MSKDVIIALDFPSAAETLEFLGRFDGSEKPYVKIGMELFYAEGPDIIKIIKDLGCKVFLDLKLHDIPNTVEKGMASLAGLGVDMTNVHAGGGIKMMKAGLKGLSGKGTLIAVTQLTSTDNRTLAEELLIPLDMNSVIAKYAENAKKAGLAGVVCSPLETGLIHKKCGDDFLTVTPGIRLAGDSMNDQKRVTTPARARELGSDMIVVGRSITQSEDPVKAYARCREEFIG